MAARASPWSKRCTGRPVREQRGYSVRRRVCLTHSNVKAAPAVPTRRAGGGWRLVPRAAARAWLGRLGPALALIVVVLVFALLTDSPARYLSPFNLRIVLSQTVIVALGAIGMTMIMISGGIDLSVGASIALTGVVAALGIAAGWPPGAATAAALVAGGLVGLGNGLLITGLRVRSEEHTSELQS